MKLTHAIWMILSLPILFGGWALFAIGFYFLFAPTLGFSAASHGSSVVAVWAFLFSFGLTSFSSLLAAQASFFNSNRARAVYRWSVAGATIVFLASFFYGLLAGLVEWLPYALSQEHNNSLNTVRFAHWTRKSYAFARLLAYR